MGNSRLRILFLHTYYPQFLTDLYHTDPAIGQMPFALQRDRILATRFGVSDAYSVNLCKLGCEAEDIIVNADHLQLKWAQEHGLALSGDIHDRRRRIVRAQIESHRPDIIYVFEWSPLGDTFLHDIKTASKYRAATVRERTNSIVLKGTFRHSKPLARLLVGQIASPLPQNRTFAAYDLMISSWPPIVDYFRREGGAAAHLHLAFDERVLERLGDRTPRHDVTFVGGFAPSHIDRAAWLEVLLEHLHVDVFGYGVENTRVESSIRAHHRGEVWGRAMYEILARSRITLNRHARIDVRGKVETRFANNMRLYEATGVGACLLTEARDNLPGLFEPGSEIVAYADEHDCVEKIRYYLGREDERETIARAGQGRTLRDHTYARRMVELLEILHAHL